MNNDTLVRIIKKIEKYKSVSFSGLGLIVYSDLHNLDIEPIVVNKEISLPIFKEEEIVKVLLEISHENNKFHDGFHLLNEKFELTHISQFVSAPINKYTKPRQERGSRYKTAFYSSLIKGIQFAAVLSNSHEPLFFNQGNEIVVV